MTPGDLKVQWQQNLTFGYDTIKSPLSFKTSHMAIRRSKWVLPVNSSFRVSNFSTSKQEKFLNLWPIGLILGSKWPPKSGDSDNWLLSTILSVKKIIDSSSVLPSYCRLILLTKIFFYFNKLVLVSMLCWSSLSISSLITKFSIWLFIKKWERSEEGLSIFKHRYFFHSFYIFLNFIFARL